MKLILNSVRHKGRRYKLDFTLSQNIVIPDDTGQQEKKKWE